MARIRVYYYCILQAFFFRFWREKLGDKPPSWSTAHPLEDAALQQLSIGECLVPSKVKGPGPEVMAMQGGKASEQVRRDSKIRRR